EIPDRAGAGSRALRGIVGVVELVESAGGGVEHDRVLIPAASGASLNRGIRPERVWPRVALVGVVERDAHLRVAGVGDDERDSVRDRGAGVPEVGVDES